MTSVSHRRRRSPRRADGPGDRGPGARPARRPGRLWAVLSLATDTFLTASNLQNLLVSVAPVPIIGVGMTAMIVTGGIDVSVGSAAPWSP